LPLVWNFTKSKFIYLSISNNRNLQWWVESWYKKLINLPLIVMFFWHHKLQCVKTTFTFRVVSHDIAFVGWFIGMKHSPLNRLWGKRGHHLLKTKPFSSRDFNSSCERLIFFCTCQIDRTISLSIAYLRFVPLMKWFMSYAQN